MFCSLTHIILTYFDKKVCHITVDIYIYSHITNTWAQYQECCHFSVETITLVWLKIIILSSFHCNLKPVTRQYSNHIVSIFKILMDVQRISYILPTKRRKLEIAATFMIDPIKWNGLMNIVEKFLSFIRENEYLPLLNQVFLCLWKMELKRQR